MKIPSLPLVHAVPGASIPQIGFGTYLIKDEKEVEQSISSALRLGYRHIDTAAIYENEAFIGNALKKLGVGGIGGSPKEAGGTLGLRREDLFITSKVWSLSMMSREDVRRSVTDSLAHLQTDYLDLCLIHWPAPGVPFETNVSHEGMKERNPEYRRLVWDELTQLFHEGKLRALGVSNYRVDHLRELEDAAVRPAVCQCEYHPLIARKTQPLLDYCAARQMVFESYRMLGGSREKNKARIQNLPLVSAIAAAHTHADSGRPVSPAQVLLKMSSQQGLVVLPKSLHEQHMRDNLDIFDFELSEVELDSLKALGESLPNGYLRFGWENDEII